jgi:acyl phosphate:glycerol-3-phosphate acyltransferase
MTSTLVFPLALLCAYLAGSINFAVLLFRLLGKQDPRTRFSGNPGVTNVYRQAGWPLAAAVLALDLGRAAMVALLGGCLQAHSLVPWVGLALIVGNHFPCFHDWRGGKGVASFLGFYAVLLPIGTALALAVYLIIFALTRVVFVASFGILLTVTGFGWAHWLHEPSAVAAVLITAVGIACFHRSNIVALWRRRRVH